MKYYKIKQGNAIIDALADPLYIVFQEGNNTVIIGEEADAFGILSYDSSVIYAVQGMKPAPVGAEYNYAVVQMEPIGADEYAQLREELDAGTEPTEPDDETPEDPSGDTAMGLPEMRLAIIALQEENATLKEQNIFLQDCLMEMANEVYK
jgi:hypothetical protein